MNSPAAPTDTPARKEATNSSPRVVVVRTGIANTASVLAALARCRATAELSSDAAQIAESSHVVLPGVGSFGPAMEELNRLGLVDVLRARINAQRPTLCVCLGLQLLCESSEESSSVRGLGVIHASITRFRSGRVPQLGWNRVEAPDRAVLVASDHFYFANSYKLDTAPPGWTASTTEYEGRFVSAIERGCVLACQFHPELSGVAGLSLIARWLHCSENALGSATGREAPNARALLSKGH